MPRIPFREGPINSRTRKQSINAQTHTTLRSSCTTQIAQNRRLPTWQDLVPVAANGVRMAFRHLKPEISKSRIYFYFRNGIALPLPIGVDDVRSVTLGSLIWLMVGWLAGWLQWLCLSLCRFFGTTSWSGFFFVVLVIWSAERCLFGNTFIGKEEIASQSERIQRTVAVGGMQTHSFVCKSSE